MSTRLCLLWHMHQPDYRHPVHGEAVMPWVRLHAAREYLDMLLLVLEQPGIRCTFNLTPSLLLQVEELASGGLLDPVERVVRRPLHTWTQEERRYLANELFSSSPSMRAGLGRYAELATRREALGSDLFAERAADREWMDLAVCFYLAWSGEAVRRDPRISDLILRGRDFSSAHLAQLRAAWQDHFQRILPAYRKAWEDGHIEVSTTPLCHPILPLLCDFPTAVREAHPDLPLDGVGFAFPQDARRQVERGLAEVERLLGRRPVGMWPSEGSLSEPALAVMGAAGVEWAAGDVQVLGRASRSPADGLHERPWRLAAGGPLVVFRDTRLSDAIGFDYQRRTPAEAVSHFLRTARQASADGLLPVILDGENAWEHYPDHGHPFLRALYAALAAAPDIELTSVGAALGDAPTPPATGTLQRLYAGSWIHAGFGPWACHRDKRYAWKLLEDARRAIHAAHGDDIPETLLTPLLRAEGSDWFWWLGDDHATTHLSLFEGVFRANLRQIWTLLGRTPPAALHQPIPDAADAPPPPPRREVDLHHPERFFAWEGAAELAPPAEGSMSRSVAAHFGALRWLRGAHTLYLRLRPQAGPARSRWAGGALRLTVNDTVHSFSLPALGTTLGADEQLLLGNWLDLALPAPPADSGQALSLSIELTCEEAGSQRWPAQGGIDLPAPAAPALDQHWF